MGAQQPGTVRVGLYDPDPLRVEGFLALFGPHPWLRFAPVPLAGMADLHRFEVALFGVRDAGAAFALASTLRGLQPRLPLVIMGPPASEADLLTLVRAGVKAYLDQAATPEQVEGAVSAIRDGSVWMPRRVLAAFIDQSNCTPAVRSGTPAAQFTARERAVLREVGAARSNSEIAGLLGIEERTVKAHTARLMRKTGAESRVALSILAASLDRWSAEAAKPAQPARPSTRRRAG
jgi:DNA-binding NarL/FixJ family response regulator